MALTNCKKGRQASKQPRNANPLYITINTYDQRCGSGPCKPDSILHVLTSIEFSFHKKLLKTFHTNKLNNLMYEKKIRLKKMSRILKRQLQKNGSVLK